MVKRGGWDAYTLDDLSWSKYNVTAIDEDGGRITVEKTETKVEGEELIDATELRPGDYIIRGEKGPLSNKLGTWGNWQVTVVKRGDQLGFIDSYTKDFLTETNRNGARWIRGVKFWVRTPRPEPESNEFGLVSP